VHRVAVVSTVAMQHRIDWTTAIATYPRQQRINQGEDRRDRCLMQEQGSIAWALACNRGLFWARKTK
jgi:hypothetical protein